VQEYKKKAEQKDDVGLKEPTKKKPKKEIR
jgi:hypothetical protein